MLHAHFTGGEPLARPDLTELVAGARSAGLYTNLIPSGLGLGETRLKALVEAGLDHIQLSFQDSREAAGNWIAGARAHAHKIELSRLIREQKIAFTVNLVIHRQNIDHLDEMIEFMADLYAQGYGDEVEFDRARDGIDWATLGHLYADYYVFQYATGISAANALAKRILSGTPGAAEDYINFLKAGNSLYSIDALKLAGVDMTQPQPVEDAFAALSGDANPLHIDPEFAKLTPFGRPIVHGMLTASMISATNGMLLQKPGGVSVEQTLKFLRPVYPGDTITASSEVVEIFPERRRLRCRTTCVNQRGELVIDGEAIEQKDVR